MRKSRIDTVKGEMDMKEFNFLASELDTGNSLNRQSFKDDIICHIDAYGMLGQT